MVYTVPPWDFTHSILNADTRDDISSVRLGSGAGDLPQRGSLQPMAALSVRLVWFRVSVLAFELCYHITGKMPCQLFSSLKYCRISCSGMGRLK